MKQGDKIREIAVSYLPQKLTPIRRRSFKIVASPYKIVFNLLPINKIHTYINQ